MVERTCEACETTFQTLSRYRLHKPECEGREIHDLDGTDAETIADQVVERVLECRECEVVQDGCESIGQELIGGDPAIVARFDCSNCGTDNENTAILQ